MDQYTAVQQLVSDFSSYVSTGPIRVVSHYDCDGICSAAITSCGLQRQGISHTVTFVKELTTGDTEFLLQIPEPTVIFTDIGSGQLSCLEPLLETHTVCVIDHHEPEKESAVPQFNPHQVGVDGSTAISGAGTAYLCMRSLQEENADLAHLALVGATGDIQKDDGHFFGINQHILEESLQRDIIEQKQGLTVFGRNKRPIQQALAYTTDPYLPGLTNNESGAVQFLSELGIQLRKNGNWRTVRDMTIEEEKQLIHGLITHGFDAERIIGDVYILPNGWELSEFASLLNACGRLEEAEIGRQVCLDAQWKRALALQKEYGKTIGKYLRLIEQHTIPVQQSDVMTIINARDAIHENMIGTVTSIYMKNTAPIVGIGMAYAENNLIKLSARVTHVEDTEYDAHAILADACERCGGHGGGHSFAAGGKIPRSEEQRFINILQEEFP